MKTYKQETRQEDKKMITGEGQGVIVKYSKDALKFLSKLESASVKRIRDGVNGLKKTPPEGDIKPMQGFSDNRKRLRVGSWRVIYRYDINHQIEVLFIIDIGNRGDIYK